MQTETIPEQEKKPSPKENRSTGSGLATTVLKHALLILVGLVMIYPLLWMVSSSFKPTAEVFTDSGLIPQNFITANYAEGWFAQAKPFGTYMMNSLIITVLAIVGNLFSCTMTAYALSRLEWKGRAIAFGLVMMTLMLPIYVLIVPQYVFWSKLGLVNTIIPLVLPKFLGVDAFFVYLLVQFFRGLPRDLDEAAVIDGAGYWRIFFQVLLPLTLPALATTAIFTFIWTWNDFFQQLIYLTKPDVMTAAVALRNFADATSGTSWGPMFAMSAITLIPVFIVFLFGQRFLVNGIATTGMK
jgi:ABC-type sugar transport system, permease component